MSHRLCAGAGLVAALLAPAAASAAPAPSFDKAIAACPAGAAAPRLTVARGAETSHRLGAFAVSLSHGALTVRSGGRVLWQSAPGAPFVTAQRGTLQATGAGGFLNLTATATACWRAQRVTGARLSGSRFVVRGSLAGGRGAVPYAVTLRPASRRRLSIDVRLFGTAADAVALTAASSRGEQIHGFGMTSRWNLKGAVLPVITREQGVGRGEQPLTDQQNAQIPGSGGSFATNYSVVPQYLTSTERGFFLRNNEVSVFDLRAARAITTQVRAHELRGEILRGDNPSQLIEAYTEYAGRMDPLPSWVDRGAIAGIQGGTAAVRQHVSELLAAGVRLTGVWLQDWVGQRQTDFGSRLNWNWRLNATRYPGWDQLVADLEAQGIRVLTYVNPMLVAADSQPGQDRNLYTEAIAKGYELKKADGSPYLLPQGGFDAALVDLSNPAARAWLKGVLVDMARRFGASGWMADFGDQYPFDAKPFSGTAAEWHNRYPDEWAKLNRDALKEAGIRDGVVDFHRSAYTTSPRSARLFWMGDQTVDWSPQDGIGSALTGTLSGGLSGFALNHSDVGGYTTIATPRPVTRSAGLLARWGELNAFAAAMFRSHEGNRPQLNVQSYSSPEVAATFGRWAKVFALLGPYRQRLERIAQRTGVPLVRPLWLTWPGDAKAASRSTEFTLGGDLLVAPVLAPGVTKQRVYLPAGHWVHLWSGRRYGSARHGTTITVAAPLGQPPVFYPPSSKVGAGLRRALAGRRAQRTTRAS
ncbi:MAG: alpha-glucosidase [Solirubrobacteraceae bacterium]